MSRIQPLGTRLAPRARIEPESAELSVDGGDVLFRDGVFSKTVGRFTISFGVGPLIGEEFDHGGVAIDPQTAHHSDGAPPYDQSIDKFFKDCLAGAAVRYVGPAADEVRRTVADVARTRRYPKHLFNPFSRAEDESTVNCNEWVRSIYLHAMKEVLDQTTNPASRTALTQAMGELISPQALEYWFPGDLADNAAKELEKSLTAMNEHYLIQFEGKTRRTASIGDVALASELSLNAYTPESYIKSRYFTLLWSFERKSSEVLGGMTIGKFGIKFK